MRISVHPTTPFYDYPCIASVVYTETGKLNLFGVLSRWPLTRSNQRQRDIYIDLAIGLGFPALTMVMRTFFFNLFPPNLGLLEKTQPLGNRLRRSRSPIQYPRRLWMLASHLSILHCLYPAFTLGMGRLKCLDRLCWYGKTLSSIQCT
jgi:hypothetical protein